MRGIDISHNNTVKDWKALKNCVDFVLIRTGYSLTNDRKFAEFMKGAISVGLPIGIWHFSYALTPTEAEAEAEFCVKRLKAYNAKFPVFFDFEYATEEYAAKKKVKYDINLRTAIHKAFCERIKALGYPAGIYTNGDYIVNKLNWDELKGYLLWLAQWPKGGSTLVAFNQYNPLSVNAKYGKPVIWQFGLGKLDGMTTNVDVDFGYMDFPVIATQTKPAPKPAATLKAGDKVAVLNTYISGGVKRARLYNSLLSFVVYHSSYDVLSVSGKRVVIGRGKTATAAIHCDNLKKV